jgi:hypothetical protein
MQRKVSECVEPHTNRWNLVAGGDVYQISHQYGYLPVLLADPALSIERLWWR